MYYELYVDVLFLVNFTMDYLLLLFLKKIFSCTATYGNICLGALIGSGLTCLVIVLPIPYAFIKLILFHVFVNGFMIRIGLKIKNTKNFIKAYFLLYIGAFLLGGVMEVLQQYVKIGSLFFVIAIGGYYLVSKMWDYIKSVQRIQQYDCMVVLYQNGKTCRVKGRIDTGNGLCDPITNQPVSILDKRAAKEFLGDEKIAQIKYIPYHSIGKKEGVLLAMKIEKMHIYGEEEYVIRDPVIGISDEHLSTEGNYQMIIHPKLL